MAVIINLTYYICTSKRFSYDKDRIDAHGIIGVASVACVVLCCVCFFTCFSCPDSKRQKRQYISIIATAYSDSGI